MFFLGNVEYGVASAVEWCVDNEDVDGRNGCTSDADCLKNGRNICDTDPSCFGIAWYKHDVLQKMRICRSNKMGPKTDGWRTMMKQGICIVHKVFHFHRTKPLKLSIQ